MIRRLMLIVVAALLVAACVPITAPDAESTIPVPTLAAQEEATEEPADAETGGETEEIVQPSGVLTGTVTHLQRSALPPGSVIDVQLQDVSRADAAAQVIAGQTITTTGETMPIPFTLIYDPAQIDPRNSYALGVRINVDGQLQWINTEHHGVLTRGAPMTGVEVVVHPVR